MRTHMNTLVLSGIKTLGIGTLLLGSLAANANVIVFADDFNANNFNSIWSVSSGNVDVGSYPDLCNNGTAGYCVDTEGTGYGTNATFSLSNPLSLLTAGTYTFAFDYGNNSGFGANGDNILNWSISANEGLVASGSVNSGSVADWSYANSSVSFNLATAFTNAVINFAQVGAVNNWGGTVLDNVVLTQTSVATPEPATLMMLVSGLIGFGIRRRRQAR